MNWTQQQYEHARNGPKQRGTLRVSNAEGRRLLSVSVAPGKAATPPVSGSPANGKPEAGSKLRNIRTEYNGYTYDSKAEANRARALDLLTLAGQVLRWERQVVFELRVADTLITTYRLDFRIHWADGRVSHEDVKGRRAGGPYDLFKIKKRLMLACFGIDVEEVK